MNETFVHKLMKLWKEKREHDISLPISRLVFHACILWNTEEERKVDRLNASFKNIKESIYLKLEDQLTNKTASILINQLELEQTKIPEEIINLQLEYLKRQVSKYRGNL